MPNPPSVSVQNLTHSFGANRVLDGFNLEIPAPEPGQAGSTICLIGPNGAGKSTLLNLLTGILRPAPRTVMTIAERPVSALATRDIALLGVFRSIQGARDVEPDLSLQSNLFLVPSIASVSWLNRITQRLDWQNRRSRLTIRIERTLEELGCAELIPQLKHKASELSHGWRLVVSAVRADISDAKLILLDEPFAGLDPVKAAAVKRLMLKWRSESKNVLFIEHIRSAAMRELIEEVADRMILLDQGRAVLDATPGDVLRNPLFVRAYTGAAEKTEDSTALPKGSFPLPDSPALTFDSVTAQYGDAPPALRAFDITVYHGHHLLLVGPNGAGKSTVLKSVMGLGLKLQGQIMMGLTELSGLRPYQIARLGVGFVPQRDRVFSDLTVARNLSISAAQLPRTERKRALEKLKASFLLVQSRATQLAGTLSGGEQAELAWAMALVGNPRVLLIDELSIGLDATRSRQLFSFLQSQTNRGLAIISAEQVYQMATQHCDRVVALREGAVVWQGPPASFDLGIQSRLFSGREV